VAAPSAVLDPTGLNISLNAQGSATGIYLQESNAVATTGLDWGEQPLMDVFNTGQYRLEDIDGVLAAAQFTRTIILPVRIIGSSKDNLDTQLSNLRYALAKASRFGTIDLVVTPGGSTKTTTFKVIGGDTLGYYTQMEDLLNRWIGQITIFAYPFGYGAKQTFGSTGSPLFGAAAGPGSFTVSVPAGSEGDVLADVTVLFDVTVDSVGALTVGCISGNTSWTVSSDITSWSAGSGGGTRAAQSNAKYKGGAAPGYIVNAASTIEEAYKKTFSTSDFPTGVPIRCIMLADDFEVVAANRGLYQMRLAVSANGVTQYGDWVSVPAVAGNGTTTHFLQGLDMGVFTFPPGPTGSVAFTGTTTISIQVQDSNASPLTCAFDQMIFLPDASSLIAEWPVSQPAAGTTIRLETDMLYGNSDGSPYTQLLTGAHVRCRGATQYGIWASDQPLANTSGDTTNSVVKAWVEYTPRYVGLAPV
jgi:hypothetical protein